MTFMVTDNQYGRLSERQLGFLFLPYPGAGDARIVRNERG